MAKKKFSIEGMDELERSFKELGKVPQTVATKSARAGMMIALRAARNNAPEDTGALKKGIIIKRERRTKPGKAVYDVMMDPAKNDVFVKMGKDGKTRYYYPASMEYGFMTVDGGYIPGYRFLSRALTENKGPITVKIVGEAAKAIDKILKRGR